MDIEVREINAPNREEFEAGDPASGRGLYSIDSAR